jgi:hypothetical protein
MLRESHSAVYMWSRVIGCYGIAALVAWKRGWEPSFIIFIVSFYAIPVLIAWRAIEQSIFPRKKFEIVPPTYQTLNL